MPASPHEVLIATLREQPSLLATLVHALTGRTLPPGLAPVDSTVRFVKGVEVRPDLLMAHGQDWTLVEVQNAPIPTNSAAGSWRRACSSTSSAPSATSS